MEPSEECEGCVGSGGRPRLGADPGRSPEDLDLAVMGPLLGVGTWDADGCVQGKHVCERGEKQPGELRGELWASRMSPTYLWTVQTGAEKEGTGQVRWENTGLSCGLEDRKEGTGQSLGGNRMGFGC